MNGRPLPRQRRAAALLLLALALPLGAAASDFAHKKKLGFDTTASGAMVKEDVTQFPMLVRLHSGNFSFSQAKADGGDLRVFAADGKTPLKYQIENFDAANELANLWVTLPKLSANSKADSVVLAWGNEKATSEADGKAAYDAAQIFVFHFGDAAGVKDATAHANHAKASSAVPLPTGPIGAALTFDGKSRIELPASATLKLAAATGFTFTAWLNPAGLENGTLYTQAGAGKGLRIGLASGRLTAAAATGVTANAALKPGAWQHVAVVGNAGQVSFYVDGVEAGSGALTLGDVNGEAVIGEGFRGAMDEVTLAGAPRSPAYVQALAASQNADSAMVALADEEGAAGEVSYFAILIGSVTIDGWIVIGLLAVMAVISLYVMISKTLMLRVAKRANAVFLDTFKTRSAELLTPGHADIAQLQADPRSKQSSVYRLYETGLFEVSKRFAAQDQAGKAHRLTSAGLEAIRATLDAAMLRENQRFNSGIVLLTIAISGGPFLGLLGTVVGVMITFAAIAAAGEVNVNSIAPGIAAALVATVAGLAVAIPALFGYNWLASQIKNLSGDSQVFVDEFVTKSAEMHAD
jgi:biopolymer transport protein ExbB